MVTYIIFFIVAIIFLFILSLSVKAINRGLRAKNNIKQKTENDLTKKVDKNKS